MSQSKIQLTMTEEEAKIVSTACEFYARIRMGQFGEIAWHCCKNHCPDDRFATDDAWLKLRKHIYPDLQGAGHSYGMGKFYDADKAFDVHQVLRHVLGDGRYPFSYHTLPECVKISSKEE